MAGDDVNDTTRTTRHDLTAEGLISLGEAARSLPKVDGRHTSQKSLWRWATRGIRGVRLESRRMGGRLFTSKPALDRFGERLAQAYADEPTTPRNTNTPSERASRSDANTNRRARAADDRCRVLGV